MPKPDRSPDRDTRTRSPEPDDTTQSSESDVGSADRSRRARRPVRRQHLPETPGRRDKKVTGVIGDQSPANTSRAGDDTRRRGWYWHWNSIVTQYAPLIGLKGVGLLNSYTVWTDRREESPTRGYAFPSQQREAGFYGEDRAELITINKILVALDLIEIRKEMVLRTDEKGRKWRVPHNFYRVKDQGDGFTLTSDAVARVVELADRDTAVYRYIRRIFSPRFAPIDSTNVWHQILEELRPTELWQRLAAKAERTEKRASARSKAGHASRRSQADEGGFSLPSDGDIGTPEATPAATENDSGESSNDSDNVTDETSVAMPNTGSDADVEPSSTGSAQMSHSTDDGSNNGRPTSVQPSNRTYNQYRTTTTDTSESVRTGRPELPDTPPPEKVTARDRAFRQFEEANERKATRAEQRLLKMLAADLEERAEFSFDESWRWIGDAIDEAVAAGSSFVAPKRIQEIVHRWSREGRGDKENSPESQRPSKLVTSKGGRSHRSSQQDVTEGEDPPHKSARREVPAPPRRGDAIRVPEFELPDCGLTNHQVWSAVLDELERSGSIARVDIDAWLRMSGIVDAGDDALAIGVPNVLAERRAAGRYRATLEAAVRRVTGVRFAIEIVLGTGGTDDDARASGA